MTATKTTKHGVIIVDDCDADLLEGAHSHKNVSGYLYARRRIDGHRVLLHRLILERMLGRELLPNEDVDHENHNGLDNQRSNLRVASRTQNCANRRKNKNSSSGFKGVSWHKTSKKWFAQISPHGKNIYLGLFDDPADAHAAYMAAAREYFGEFANDGGK